MQLQHGNASGGGDPMIRNPKHLIKWGTESAFIKDFTNTYDATASTFWSNLDTMVGAYASGISTSLTQIAHISGAGKLYGVIGPEVASGAASVIEITVDGTVYTITDTRTSGSSGTRVVIGDIFRLGSAYTTANHAGGITGAYTRNTSDTSAVDTLGGSRFLRSPQEIGGFLKFDTQLRVRASRASAGGNALNDYSGVMYSLDG